MTAVKKRATQLRSIWKINIGTYKFDSWHKEHQIIKLNSLFQPYGKENILAVCQTYKYLCFTATDYLLGLIMIPMSWKKFRATVISSIPKSFAHPLLHHEEQGTACFQIF